MMQVSRTPPEGESGAPEVEAGLKGVGAVEKGDGDGEPVPPERNLGLLVHEWGLNPLFWSYVKLFVRDVHGLGTFDGIDDSHVLQGKAIQRVEVLGMVVNIKPGTTKTFGGYVKYVLDDGTGLLPCTQYDHDSGGRHTPGERHQLGDLLAVQGKLKRFRGAREVVMTSSRRPADPNEETLHWLRCVDLWRTAYTPPFQRSEYVDDERFAGSTRPRVTRCDCGAPYSEPVGYCRCVAAALASDPDFDFRDALLSRLASKEENLNDPNEHLRFQFARDVRDDPSLQEAAARVVSATRSPGTLGGGSGAHVAVTGRRDGAVARDALEANELKPSKTVLTLTSGRGTGGGVRSDARSSPAKVAEASLGKAKVMKLLRAVLSSLHRDGVVHLADKARDVYLLLSRGRVLQPGVMAVCRQRGLRLTQESEIIRVLQGSTHFHDVPDARIRACVNRMKKSKVQPEYT